MAGTPVEPKIVHATCVVERSFPKPPRAVFAVLSTPSKVREWMAGGESSELLEFTCEFREGGAQVCRYKMGANTPIAGAIITNEARFQYIVPDQRIVMASTMKMGDRLFSASQVTFELAPTETGSDLFITHQGAFFEGSDGPAMREQGWNQLADKLTAAVGE